MFFDALNPAYLEGFRAIYVFCSICADFRACSFAYSITTKHPETPLGAAAGAGRLVGSKDLIV